MSDKELAPISVEVVAIDDLDSIKVIANTNASKESNAGIGERTDAFLGLASDVIDLVEGKQLYKVEVPEGYSLKDLVASKKDPEAVRALVRDPKGRLSGDVSLKATGVSPAQIASVGLAAAATVVGQAYMSEISDSLQRIDAKLESIASMIAGDQKAKVKNALDIARTYAALHDDYLQKPAEARQAARNEIESRYNDVGQVIDWITEQLAGVEDEVRGTAEREKDLEPLLKEIQSYEAQFGMCLQALSALAMTRMYYDGSMDDRSALIEEQRILGKSQGFLKKRQTLAALMEMKIGGHERGAHRASSRRPEERPQKAGLPDAKSRRKGADPRGQGRDAREPTLGRVETEVRSRRSKRRDRTHRSGIPDSQDAAHGRNRLLAHRRSGRLETKKKRRAIARLLLHHPLEHGVEQPDE